MTNFILFDEINYKCNDIAGKFKDKYTYKDLLNQVKVIKEEVEELEEAIETANHVNLLKELADVVVTVHGMVDIIEYIGYNVEDALVKVANNNLSKFTPSDKVADESVIDYTNKGVKVKLELNTKYNVWVIKDENNKYKKPIDYKPCNVEAYSVSSETFFNKITGWGV